MVKPVLVVECGPEAALREKFHSFEARVAAAVAGTPAGEIYAQRVVVSVYQAGCLPADVTVFHSVLLSGSESNATDLDSTPWMRDLAQWLRDVAVPSSVPILGVCFGHQILAEALGGEVSWNTQAPVQWQLGTVDVDRIDTAESDPLGAILPTKFVACETHSQRVTSLPKGAVSLAGTSLDPHQLIRFAPSVYGTQFHPEYTDGCVAAWLSALPPSVTEHNDGKPLRPCAVGPQLIATFLTTIAKKSEL